MTTYSSHLRLTKQAVGENPDTWGLILNEQVFELLEESITGMLSLSLTASVSPVVLTTVNGATDNARNMILNFTGNPGGNRHIHVPVLSKLYLCIDSTTGGFAITVKTPAGTGVVLNAGKPQWVYCDGTNVVGVSHAETAEDADNVTTTIDNIAISFYTRKNVQNLWTRGQSVQHEVITFATTMTPDLELSNAFRTTLTASTGTIANPDNPISGMSWSLLIRQDASGSKTVSWAGKYQWPGGVTPTLTTTGNRGDLFTFYYDVTTDRHLGSVLQNYTFS